jgi:imidazolonepropionase-like amidohydrolase
MQKIQLSRWVKRTSVGMWVAALAVSALASSFDGVKDPYPSTYTIAPSPAVLIQDATLLTGTGEKQAHTDLLLRQGLIAAIGTHLSVPADAVVVVATGKTVTPGIIDIHSHLGVYPSPGTDGNDDGNEATAPSTAQVWAEHSVWPQDPGFETALEGGVTTLEILPGSANLIGGRSAILKNVPAATVQAMKFPNARQGLKMACGENPKRVYGRGRNTAPSTRMGNMAGYRAQWVEAKAYLAEWKKYRDDVAAGGERQAKAKEPKRDLRLDTLASVLNGEIDVQMHCYRADEMAQAIDLSKEFGYTIAAFHHAVEAYKIADRLAEQHICAAMWADWWGFKMEANDGIQENIVLVDMAPQSCAIVHSDSEEGIQRLNQEAAKAMARAAAMGVEIKPEHAIQWLTLNPAKALKLADRVGTLEVGKMADVIIWSGDPFSVYTLTEQVYIDGVKQFDRAHPALTPRSDFMLGQKTTQTGVSP